MGVWKKIQSRNSGKIYLYNTKTGQSIWPSKLRAGADGNDSDDLGKHPLGEKNFILPITKMYGSNTIFIESEPDKKDFTT